MTKEERRSDGARLFCPGDEGLNLKIQDQVTIGSGPDNDLKLPAGSVSARQARIRFDSELGAYSLENLGGGRGLRLDGQRVRGPVRLADLHVITFGTQDFLFVRTHGDAGSPADSTPHATEEDATLVGKAGPIAVPDFAAPESPAPAPGNSGAETLVQQQAPFSMPPLEQSGEVQVEESDPGTGSAWLVVMLPEEPLQYRLGEGSHTLGRSADCDIQLSDSSISRRHAVFEVDSSQVRLRDLESLNYTFVNDQRVRSAVTVAAGDNIRFGSLEARIERRGETHD